MKLRKKQMTFGLMAGCAMILTVTNLYGQKKDSTKVVGLNEVIITATRSEKNPDNIGRSISVITSSDIKNSGATNISEILNLEEGIYSVGTQQNPGSITNIFTRGANSNQTVILIDGVPLTDPSTTDNSIDLSELSIADIDKIEIVRGSHSTLYGSSAIGGVINIITHKNNLKPGFHLDADLSGGVFKENGKTNTENLFLNYSHGSGLYVNAEIFNMLCKGFNSTIDTITNPNTYKNPDLGDDFNKTDIIGKIGYRTNYFDLYVGYKKLFQESDIDEGAFKDDENYTINLERNLYTYGASYKINQKFSLSLIGGISDFVRKTVDDSSRIDALGNTDKSYFNGKNVSSLSNHELQLNYSNTGLQIVAGGGLNKETMSTKTYYFSGQYGIYEAKTDLDSLNINTTTNNGFIHADLNGELFNSTLKPYSLGLGARYLDHSTFGSFLTYEINPSIKIKDNTLLYFSYSTGFNAPSLYQLYSPEKNMVSGIQRGNKTLKPEESQTWEIGIKQNLNDHLKWSACYFNTVVENIIDYVYLWNKNQEIDSLSYLDYYGDTYINLGKQTNRGVEFSITSKIAENFIISANFSLVNGKMEYKPEKIDTSHTHGNHIQLYSNGAFINKETESIGLVRRPNTANISFTYLPINKLSLRLDIKYVGARNDIYYNSSLGPYGALGTIGVEDYTLLNFYTKYEIIKGLTAMFRIENMLDTKYFEIRGYATRGRGFYGGISYSI